MKKNSFLYNDEIDLIALFKIIWGGKIKILLITIISFLVGFWYSSQIPINYLNSLNISDSRSIQSLKVDNIKKLLNSGKFNNNKLNLESYIDELQDYEELLLNLKNTKIIQENFSKLNIEDQEIKLFQYINLFEIVKSEENKVYTINFKWHDPDEAKKVLQDALNLTSKNLKKFVYRELLEMLEFEKRYEINRDKVRLVYLEEQSAIAKELNIQYNAMDNTTLNQSILYMPNNVSNFTYYLRGFKAIDKEIELIKSRDYQKIKFIEQELENFKKENIEWVNYNIDLMNIKLLKNTKPIFLISILLGLVVGILYVLISNGFKSHTASRKTR